MIQRSYTSVLARILCIVILLYTLCVYRLRDELAQAKLTGSGDSFTI